MAGTLELGQVVLPLPGYAIELPPNMKDWYEATHERLGLSLSDFQVINADGTCSFLKGGYRRIVELPVDVTVKYLPAEMAAPDQVRRP